MNLRLGGFPGHATRRVTLFKGKERPDHMFARRRKRGSLFILLSTRVAGFIDLRSDFVEAIQHFAARPQ
jgi:hypothetical protein